MTDTDEMAGRILRLMAGSSWFSFMGEMETLINESTEEETYDWAMEVCPSLRENVPKLRRMIEDMVEEMSNELTRYIVDTVEGKE